MSKDRYSNTRYARFAMQALRRRVRRLDRRSRRLRKNKARGVELVHKARVAARELRTAIRLFDELLPKSKLKAWIKRIREVTRALGEVRDRDVQLLWLNEVLAADLDRKLRPGVQRVRLRIRQAQEPHRAESLKLLRRLKKDDVAGQLYHWIDDQLRSIDDRIIEASRQAAEPVAVRADEHGRVVISRPVEPKADEASIERTAAAQSAAIRRMIRPASEDEIRQLTDKAREVVLARFDALLGYADCADRPDDVQRLHDMRIAAKQLRYTLEMFAPIVAGGFEPLIALTKALQTLLGDIHDCDVWVEHLHAFETEETQRVVAFYGNARPMSRLKPGITYLLEDRAATRHQIYEAFQSLWQEHTARQSWTTLRDSIVSLRVRSRHQQLLTITARAV